MSTEQLNRMESMLTQLVTTVGKMNTDLQAVKAEQQAFRNEIKGLRAESETRHQEVMRRFHSIEADLDYIWEKASRNERDIARMKK